MAEDELGHVNLFLLVHFDWDARTVVLDLEAVAVEFNLDVLDSAVAPVVVGRVGQNLIEYFNERRRIRDRLFNDFEIFQIVDVVDDPHLLRYEFFAADVRVGAFEDVIALR